MPDLKELIAQAKAGSEAQAQLLAVMSALDKWLGSEVPSMCEDAQYRWLEFQREVQGLVDEALCQAKSNPLQDTIARQRETIRELRGDERRSGYTPQRFKLESQAFVGVSTERLKEVIARGGVKALLEAAEGGSDGSD